MKERPILFSGEMVRAILDGRKTQTRRIIKSPAKNMQEQGQTVIRRNPDNDPWYKDRIWSMRTKSGMWGDYTHERFLRFCPQGVVGDHLWVRETFADELGGMRKRAGDHLFYRADDCVPLVDVQGGGWKPSIHMPRWASRITLEVTGVRVERVQDISEEDALAEGVDPSSLWVEGPRGTLIPPDKKTLTGSHPTARHAFSCLWESINGVGSWQQNPWLWVIEFKRVDAA